jgi:diacylglycerol O-acyltransferase
MGNNNYERLTPQDLQFLVMESPSTPMDVVSAQIYGPGRLTEVDGGVDIEGYRDLIATVLHHFPRFRQKLKWIPYADIPVWVDDPNFNIEYHVRHTALPRPGSAEQLKNLTARITERALDRERPLWEVWLVEGLEHQHYAIISKIHHCMLDSVGKYSLSQVLMSEDPEPKLPPKRPFVPTQSPSEVSLLWDEWNRRYAQPIDALRNAGELLRRTTGIGVLERRFGAVKESLVSIIRRPRYTPVNGELCSHRRAEWLEMPLEQLNVAAHQLGCKSNDIVIALLAGGVRELYRAAQLEPQGEFKLAMPVTLHADDESQQCSVWVVDVPIEEADVLVRIERVAKQTAEFQCADKSVSVEMIIDPMASSPSGFLSLFRVSKEVCANTMLTYVAGPRAPLYSMGACMQSIYPHLPLLPGIGLTTGLMSYRDKLYWGFNGDYDLIPDMSILREGVADAYYRLMIALDIDYLDLDLLPEPASGAPKVNWQKPTRGR